MTDDRRPGASAVEETEIELARATAVVAVGDEEGGNGRGLGRRRCVATTRRFIVEASGGRRPRTAATEDEGMIEMTYDDVRACARGGDGRSTLSRVFGGGRVTIRLTTRDGRWAEATIGGREGDVFCDAVERGMAERRREMRPIGGTSEADIRRRASGASAATAGVGGAVNRQLERAAETQRTMDEAFSDLESLMAKASDMVALAERLATSTEKKSGTESELQRLVLSLGIKSPVTRAGSGAEFHRELGAQLARWIKPVLDSSNGIITLTDAFCLFNRARGVEVVSPQDMLRACESWESQAFDVHLREFENGVKVIHTTERTDDEACARIKALLPTPESSLDAYEAAQTLETTPEIALEYLRMAESRGILLVLGNCLDVVDVIEIEEVVVFVSLFFETVRIVHAERLRKFAVRLQGARFIGQVFQDDIRLFILEVPQAQEDDVPGVHPHLLAHFTANVTQPLHPVDALRL
ncbi:vacuolar sorting protein VPS36 [Ostreococcus tauri]|uniref:Vacuolar protein-sorting-associated protein 36 n=1 Tax=Ostreococcus tauri TaxID=70448 RepID=A0A1Y5IC98_OSTTA|nr:vacuolar sorting protein VPS36 [Ostreococcus tauri]